MVTESSKQDGDEAIERYFARLTGERKPLGERALAYLRQAETPESEDISFEQEEQLRVDTIALSAWKKTAEENGNDALQSVLERALKLYEELLEKAKVRHELTALVDDVRRAGDEPSVPVASKHPTMRIGTGAGFDHPPKLTVVAGSGSSKQKKRHDPLEDADPADVDGPTLTDAEARALLHPHTLKGFMVKNDDGKVEEKEAHPHVRSVPSPIEEVPEQDLPSVDLSRSMVLEAVVVKPRAQETPPTASAHEAPSTPNVAETTTSQTPLADVLPFNDPSAQRLSVPQGGSPSSPPIVPKKDNTPLVMGVALVVALMAVGIGFIAENVYNGFNRTHVFDASSPVPTFPAPHASERVPAPVAVASSVPPSAPAPVLRLVRATDVPNVRDLRHAHVIEYASEAHRMRCTPLPFVAQDGSIDIRHCQILVASAH